MVANISSDLQVVPEQILITEMVVSVGEPLLGILPNAQVPLGLRTLDGSLNNPVSGNETFGIRQSFPPLHGPAFRNDVDGDCIALGPPQDLLDICELRLRAADNKMTVRVLGQPDSSQRKSFSSSEGG